jgi:flagellar P-ring protein precursor FlgI
MPSKHIDLRLQPRRVGDWHGFRSTDRDNASGAPNVPGHRIIAIAGRAAVAALALLLSAPCADAASRIKDLVDFEGVRENQLVGYGLVVGLNGTGDSLQRSPFTRQSLQAMLERMGINTRDVNLRTANVAAVMVTGNLPAFATQGTRIDVSVSALGDATSLQGGTLLVTPLHGADGEVYAVGQGPVAISGFAAQADAATITRGVPTAGRIANGAIVEREIRFSLLEQRSLRLALRNPDLTTATRIAEAINAYVAVDSARTLDPGTVRIDLPEAMKGDLGVNLIAFLTDIEQLRVEVDLPAKVVIDEKTGIIVMGRDVRVSTIAIAQGNLTISVTEAPQVSQPEPFSNGETVVVPRSRVSADDESSHKLAIVEQGITLRDLVDGLNALGIGPRDMISILQAIKAAGALQAEIEVM